MLYILLQIDLWVFFKLREESFLHLLHIYHLRDSSFLSGTLSFHLVLFTLNLENFCEYFSYHLSISNKFS